MAAPAPLSGLSAVVLTHVEALEALLAPLQPGSKYLAVLHGEDVLTERAEGIITRARDYARTTARAVWETTGTASPEDADYADLEDLNYLAGYVFSVIAAALDGLEEQDLPAPILGGIRMLLDGLKGRVSALSR